MIGRRVFVRNSLRAVFGILGVACLMGAASASAHDWRDDRDWPRRHEREWEPPPHRDWAPPPHHHHMRWEDGRWWRGPHEGRFGWWWVVGDRWFLFPMPIRPVPPPRDW